LFTISAGIAFSEAFISTSTLASRPPKLALYASINIVEDAQRDIAPMEEWASYGGVQKVDGFQLSGEDLDGYLDVSAMTTQEIPANTPVLYIPNEMILSSNKAMEEFGRLEDAEELIVANGFENELRQYYLMIKILLEMERGQDSQWFPYLNSLPRYFSNGASMTKFCYRCIPPLLTSLCQKERAKLNNHLSVKRVHFLSEETKGDDELWKWAFQVVYTRGFEATDGSGDFRIVPMADMLNHGTETEVELAYDEYGNCYAQTTKDVAANSPLRMSYGDPTNPSFLLARYGFLDESSPATFCTPKVIRTRLNEGMGNLGYDYSSMLFYKDTGDVSEEVWDTLLYMALGEDDEGKQQEFYQAHMYGDYQTKQSLREQYYPQAAAKLLEYVDNVLQELDLRSGKAEYGGQVVGNDHPRLPLILRQNDFAKNTLLAVRSRHFD